MPILITLKDPAMTLVVAGEIKDTPEDVKEWDRIFRDGVLIVKGDDKKDPKNILIPIWGDSNIAFMQEISDEELAERRKKFEEDRKVAEAERKRRGGPGGSSITKPGFIFPHGRGSGGRH